jgi:hypothetical protein
LALVLFTAKGAHAAANSGTVYGYMKFWQAQGGYCPVGADCTGARYTTQFNSLQPIKRATVFLRTTSGVQLGYSTTSTTGYYSISYDTNEPVNSVYVYWIPEEVGGRYRVVTSSGGWNNMTTPTTSLTSGTGRTKNWGTYQWGTSLASANATANVYDGAQRMYNDGLDSSNAMINNYTGVRMYMDQQANCSTSCLWSPVNRQIYLDNLGYYAPLGRVMHEMGHAASYIASPAIRSNNGSVALGCGVTGGGWTYTNSQSQCTATEEGFASFAAVVAMYYDSANDVRTCTESQDDCYDGTSGEFDIEGFDSTCSAAGADATWPGGTLAYLWDVMDANDGTNFSFYDVIDTLAAYDVGFGNHQVNEQFNSSWAYDNTSGRSGYDMYWNMLNDPSGPQLDTNAARLANCQ